MAKSTGPKALLSLILAFTAPAALAQAISLDGSPGKVQDFNTLPASGTGTTLPEGWYFAESGANANGRYTADDGTSNSGDTYSYGSAGSSDRALGGLLSGKLVPVFGAQLRNDTGAMVGTIEVEYTGEQWRLGNGGRADRLAFEYSLDAAGVADAAASWSAVPGLDFESPTTIGAARALDGNAPANRRLLSGSIEGIVLAPGQTLWVRWRDIDVAGADDGLAIDDVRFSATGGGAPIAPVIVSMLPADGASNVPPASDLRVSFSQPVTTAPGAFALECGGSAVALHETGSGTSRTLTPDTLLPESASCQFHVNAAAVTNATDQPLTADGLSRFTVAAAPGGGIGGYYAKVNTSSPEQLRCTLHQTIRGHTVYPYSGAGTNTWTILELAQADPGNPDGIIDVYRNRSYARGSDRAGTGSGPGRTYNREHTWPNSLGFPGQTGNLGLPSAPYTDTHMLWLSDTDWNADRGNMPYANCPQGSGCSERKTDANGGVGGTGGGYPGDSNWLRGPNGNAGSFEVWNHRKGEMARAIFYMAIRYEGGTHPVTGQMEPELELTNDRAKIINRNNYSEPAYMGLLDDLLAWHLADPPDADEIARNDLIQTFQGNRNPFVDHPEWATLALFESENPTVCEPLEDDVIFANGFEID